MINLLKNFIDQAKGQRLIFISTCSNYGLMSEGVFAKENSNLNPLSLYAKSKVAAEQYLLENVSDNLEIVVLRFATAFGLAPRMRFDLTVNQFSRSLALGEKLTVFDCDTWRPYCHIKDFGRLISVVFDAAKELVDREVFNAGGAANNLTKRQVLNIISEHVSETDLTFNDDGGDPRNYQVDFTKVKQILGFQPAYSVDDGVKEIVSAVEKGFFTEDVLNNLYGNYDL